MPCFYKASIPSPYEPKKNVSVAKSAKRSTESIEGLIRILFRLKVLCKPAASVPNWLTNSIRSLANNCSNQLFKLTVEHLRTCGHSLHHHGLRHGRYERLLDYNCLQLILFPFLYSKLSGIVSPLWTSQLCRVAGIPSSEAGSGSEVREQKIILPAASSPITTCKGQEITTTVFCISQSGIISPRHWSGRYITRSNWRGLRPLCALL